jgi:hypothetical protein
MTKFEQAENIIDNATFHPFPPPNSKLGYLAYRGLKLELIDLDAKMWLWYDEVAYPITSTLFNRFQTKAKAVRLINEKN